jgi:UrcA family protein
MKRLTTGLCGLTLSLAAIATPAISQDGDIVVSGPVRELPGGILVGAQVISYADLDLSYAADRAVLNRRIASSVREVCNRLRRAADNPVLNSRCENSAMRNAYRQVRTERLGG